VQTTTLQRSPTLQGSSQRTLHPGHPFLVTTRPRSSLLTKYKDNQPIPAICRLAVRQQHYRLQSLPHCVGLSAFSLGPTHLHDQHSSCNSYDSVNRANLCLKKGMKTSGQLRDRSQPRLHYKTPTSSEDCFRPPVQTIGYRSFGYCLLDLHTYTSYSVTSRESIHRLLGRNRSVFEYSLMR